MKLNATVHTITRDEVLWTDGDGVAQRTSVDSVVLAIGALLISLLALSVRDGIERARSASCRNNLRQFGIAIGKYK